MKLLKFWICELSSSKSKKVNDRMDHTANMTGDSRKCISCCVYFSVNEPNVAGEL